MIGWLISRDSIWKVQQRECYTDISVDVLSKATKSIILTGFYRALEKKKVGHVRVTYQGSTFL